MATIPRPWQDRFFEKINFNGPMMSNMNTCCHIWTGVIVGKYGQFAIDPFTKFTAHRLMWELTFGPIQEGLFVCHHCDNKICVRPDHLWLGTHLQNMADRNNKGRQNKGRSVNTVRLTPEVIPLIRADQRTLKAIADEYGVSLQSIWAVKKNISWKHIP